MLITTVGYYRALSAEGILAASFADHIVLLNDGRVVANGG
jgi:ABC-type hemin transport system substrate-binding protein